MPSFEELIGFIVFVVLSLGFISGLIYVRLKSEGKESRQIKGMLLDFWCSCIIILGLFFFLGRRYQFDWRNISRHNLLTLICGSVVIIFVFTRLLRRIKGP